VPGRGHHRDEVAVWNHRRLLLRGSRVGCGHDREPAHNLRGGGLGMSDLTAIDILINPDDTMMEHARAANARMLASVPQGFALDEHHHPHITTLQRYVRTSELDKVFAAVEGVLGRIDVKSLSLSA